MDYALCTYEGHCHGYQEGHEERCIDKTGSGYTPGNSIYNELTSFLVEDKTDENEHRESEYTCFSFVSNLNNNAEDGDFGTASIWNILETLPIL